MEFLAVVCALVLLTPGISAASTLSASDQTQATQSEPAPQQTPPPSAAPPPPSADQLPAPRETIHFAPYAPLKSIEGMSSTYIPLDSWIYPAVMRLYGMGFVDTVFLGMRPWTRLSVAHMLEQSSDRITDSTNDEAIDIFTALERDLQPDMPSLSTSGMGELGSFGVPGSDGDRGMPLRQPPPGADRHQ